MTYVQTMVIQSSVMYLVVLQTKMSAQTPLLLLVAPTQSAPMPLAPTPVPVRPDMSCWLGRMPRLMAAAKVCCGRVFLASLHPSHGQVA